VGNGKLYKVDTPQPIAEYLPQLIIMYCISICISAPTFRFSTDRRVFAAVDNYVLHFDMHFGTDFSVLIAHVAILLLHSAPYVAARRSV